jgi:hypoxanthine phosphoribosyltransferase
MSEKSKFPDRFITTQFIPYIKASEIEAVVESLANTIEQKYAGQELYVICVLKGSMIFTADLIRKLKTVKVYLDFVKLKSFGRDKESSGTISFSKDIGVNLQDKNVIIVEEIIDTGRALSFLKNRILQCQPKNLEIISLFDKPYKRAVPIKADFIGKKIDDQFIVGYGLDLEEYGRNLQDIYFLKYPN